MFAVGSPILLYPSLLMAGFLFGGMVALIAVNVADIFGTKFVATNFGAMDSAPILGTYFFATFIVSLFYKDNYFTIESGDDASDDDFVVGTCVGVQCFRMSFVVNAIFCGVSAGLCYLCHLFTPIPELRQSSSSH